MLKKVSLDGQTLIGVALTSEQATTLKQHLSRHEGGRVQELAPLQRKLKKDLAEGARNAEQAKKKQVSAAMSTAAASSHNDGGGGGGGSGSGNQGIGAPPASTQATVAPTDEDRSDDDDDDDDDDDEQALAFSVEENALMGMLGE